jgi:putative toxin-antitoxin system antitoxin component (TIGR02293 family)
MPGAIAERPASDLYARIQQALGLTGIRSDEDMLGLVERRLPVKVIEALIRSGLGADEVYSLILPQRTLSYRKTRKEALTAEESDRALRIARTLALAETVFGEHAKALRWLRKPKQRFGGRSPLEVLATETGARLVEEILYQIDYGMAA